MNTARRVPKTPSIAFLAGIALAWLALTHSLLATPPATPSVSVQDVTLREGTGSETLARFEVSLSPPQPVPLTLEFYTADGSALAGLDYLPRQGTVTVPAGVSRITIAVSIIPDSLAEGVETFELLLRPDPNLVLAKPRASATLLDDDIPAVSAEPISVVEGSTLETLVRVPITLSLPSTLPVSVVATTLPGSAQAPSDFTLTRSVVTFPPGSQRQDFEFPIRPDNVAEFNETVLVQLSSPTNATLATATATAEVLILDDDPTPSISVVGASVREPTGDAASLEFRVQLSGPSTQPVRVSYSTRNGTATSGIDYLARIGTLLIPPGETEAILDVTVLGDALAEPDEVLSMVLRNPVNATLGTAEAFGDILDDDRPISISVMDASSLEGGPGNRLLLSFEVLLSAQPTNTVTVHYTTLPGSASAGTDFITTTGILTFVSTGVGNTRHVVQVPIVGDDQIESNESLQLRLTQAENAVVHRAEALGILLNDDGDSLAIEDTAVTEGDSEDVTALFNVQRFGPALGTVTAAYETFPITAIPGTDFVAHSGVITFLPGQTHATIPVLIRSDRLAEPDKTFGVRLVEAQGATLRQTTATGTLLDNDLPGIRVEPITLAEGSSGPVPARFVVRLDSDPTQEITVDFHVESRTASEGADFLPVFGTLRFPPGIIEQSVSVPVVGDTLDEDHETFALILSNPSFAHVLTPETLATLIDDDPAPVVAIEDSEVRECTDPHPATHAQVSVRLNTPSGRTVHVPFQTRPITALADVDYASTTNTVVFPPGSTLQTILIPLVCDDANERDEFFEILLGAPDNAVLGRARARVRILDDDPPLLTIADVQLVEGTGGATEASFLLTLDASAPDVVAIDYATVDVSATAGADYLPVAGTLFIFPGTVSDIIRVPIVPDTLAELDETFRLVLTNPINIRLAREAALATVFDDDLPSLRGQDVSLVVPHAASIEASVELTLSQPTPLPVHVRFTTANGTATLGDDFEPTSGTVTFPPGQTRQTVTVPIHPNTLPESEEFFWLELGPVTNAVLEAWQVRITLTPEPPPNLPPTVSLSTPTWADQATSGTVIPLSAQASDPDGTVSLVTFHVDNLLVGQATAPPFGVLWTNSLPGTFTLTAQATDNAGTTTTSAPVVLRLLPPPSLVASNQSVLEASGIARIPLTLSRTTRETVRVQVATREDSATQDRDFLPLLTTVEFAPGDLTRVLEIPILDDAIPEPDESFFLEFAAPENVTLDLARLVITIVNDDTQQPTNHPPEARIAHPQPLAIVPIGTPIPIEVDATDPDGPVARVEFFVDGIHVGTDATHPFRFDWHDAPPGDHRLLARVIDPEGAVTDSDTVLIAVTDSCGRIAIVANPADPEIDRLREFLFELGLPAEVFDRVSAAASPELLGTFDLVIWHDGGLRELAARDVQTASRLADAGMPLYFIGDHLVDAANNLDPTDQAAWIGLVRLRPGPPGSVTNRVSFLADELPTSVSAILRDGKVGDVSDFEYPFDTAAGTRPESDREIVLARSGNREVLVALPDDDGPFNARRISQTFRVTHGGDDASHTERKRLFQNAVWWLLNCRLCSNLNLVPLASLEPAPDADPGSAELLLTVLVHPTGACEALSVRVTCQLPSHLRFVQAESERGVWEHDPDQGTVTFVLGRLPTGNDESLRVRVRPLHSGPATIRIRLTSLNEAAGALQDNETEVSTDVTGPPTVRIGYRSPGQLELAVDGQPGVVHHLEVAPTPDGPWTESLTLFLTPDAPSARVPLDTAGAPRFFRVRTP